jgi:Putative beta-barrel porin 2
VRLKKLPLALACLLLAAPVRAQAPISPAPDLSEVRLRLGPVYVDPSFSLSNLGLDTNVFNEADDQLPKKDFTFTVTPAANLWMRIGPTWLSGRVNEDVVWYKKYSGERSSNTSYNAAWNVPLNRLVFAVDAERLNTRERPSYEIDARSQRVERTYRGALEIRALSKTFLGVQASHHEVDYDRAAVFLGTSLHEELNRTVTTAGGSVRYELTPLTSVVLAADREQDRFPFSPLRDSNSIAATIGLRFDPDALIKGSANFGYRDFRPLDPTLPRYRGSTAEVSLVYVAGGATQLTGTVTRDVEYSFEIQRPYFLQTGGTIQVAQQIYGPVDVVARYGLDRLAYRTAEDAIVAGTVGALDRVDRVHSYGGGFGYHMGSRIRIGVNLDRQTRFSSIENRRYAGLRLGTTVTYGR